MKMIDYAMYKPIEDMTPGGMCAAIGSLRFEVARLRQDNAQLQYALEQSESAHLGLTHKVTRRAEARSLLTAVLCVFLR